MEVLCTILIADIYKIYCRLAYEDFYSQGLCLWFGTVATFQKVAASLQIAQLSWHVLYLRFFALFF